MGKFALAQDMAAKGSQDMQDDFAKVGITLNDLATLSDEDLFSKAVDGLAEMGDGAAQTAVSMKLFGKAARDLNFSTFQDELKKNGQESEEAARLLLVGAEAADSLERAFRQLQIIALRVFEPVIQGLADFDLQAEETQKTIKVLGSLMAAIGSAILVANIIKLVGAFKQLSLAARAVAVAQTAVVALTGPAGWAVIAGATLAAAGAYKALDVALDGAGDSAEVLADSITDVAEAETEVKDAKVIQAGTDQIALQLAKDRVATSQQNLALNQAQLQQSIDAIGVEKDFANLQKANLAAENAAKKEIQAIEALINQELEKATSTSDEQVTLYQAQQDVIRANVNVTKELNQAVYDKLQAEKAVTEEQRKQLASVNRAVILGLANFKQMENLKVLTGEMNQEEFNQIVAIKALRLEGAQATIALEEQLKTARAANDAAEIASIQQQITDTGLLTQAKIDAMEAEIAIQKQIRNSSVAGAVEAISQIQASLEPFQMAQDAITQTWGKIGSAIDDMVDNGKSSFSDLADSILKDLAKMILKAYIFKAISGLGGALGFDMSFLEGRAKGGPVDGNTPYMVGEKGPELFVPQGAGNIIPNNKLQGSMGTGTTQATQAAPITNNYITNNINALDSKSVQQVFAENRQSLLGTVEYARKETAYGI